MLPTNSCGAISYSGSTTTRAPSSAGANRQRFVVHLQIVVQKNVNIDVLGPNRISFTLPIPFSMDCVNANKS
jgi:hypothetical protein